MFVQTGSTYTLRYTPSLHPDLRRRLPPSRLEMGLTNQRVWRTVLELPLFLLMYLSPRTHGPLIHKRATEKVTRHVEDAIAQGAQVLIGGKVIENTNFFQPTVLSDVPANALISTEETFGPLAALVKFETEEEVIRFANSTNFGLAGYFFSRDVGRVWRVAEKLEVGMVGVNTGLISQAVIPFGGVKESGLGREGGPHGIDEYLNEKLIVFGGL